MFKDFGTMIRKALLKNNMTQKQAAEQLHITPQVLNHYINNRRMPSLDCFLQLIDLLDLNDTMYSACSFDNVDIQEYIYNTIPQLDDEQKRLIYFLVRYFDRSNPK